MKIAVMVRQLDPGHILWCGRVVRVERAHRVPVVRSVQKMPDVGNGVIGFGHIRFVVHDGVVTGAFPEDEFVGCWDRLGEQRAEPAAVAYCLDLCRRSEIR